MTPHLPTAACIPVDYTLMLIPTKYTQIHNLSFLGGRNAQTLAHTLNIHVLVDDLDGCYQALRWVQDLW
ncbi:MAG: hypothetical protein OSW77_04095, partial [Proteobacteria bacterium]|nr:hypothetical protein [Pseudomonadota bacterium]